jgi:hypothetical protein
MSKNVFSKHCDIDEKKFGIGNEYEYSYLKPIEKSIFPVNARLRYTRTNDACLSGKLKRLFVKFKFSDISNKDIYLLGVEGDTIFYSLPVISFTNTFDVYNFNFSPAFTTKNNNNTVLNIEINNIPIPYFYIPKTPGVYFCLSLRYDDVVPIIFDKNYSNYFFIQFSLNLTDSNINII